LTQRAEGRSQINSSKKKKDKVGRGYYITLLLQYSLCTQHLFFEIPLVQKKQKTKTCMLLAGRKSIINKIVAHVKGKIELESDLCCFDMKVKRHFLTFPYFSCPLKWCFCFGVSLTQQKTIKAQAQRIHNAVA